MRPDQCIKVAYLGPEGTYSHQAALQQFSGISTYDVEYQPTSSIPECFESLEKEDSPVDYSVVPLENSTNGQVVFSYDLLRDRMLNCAADEVNSCKPKIEVINEVFVSIAHCLVSRDEIPDGLEALRDYEHLKLYSHPQVWGQVAQYVDELQARFSNIKTITKINCKSTSDAVLEGCMNHISNKSNNTLHLIVANATAASIYNAHILDRDINDKPGNTTRFLVLANRYQHQKIEKFTGQSNSMVALMSFTIRQDDPGSLVDILAVLKDYNLNMCSISSRPYEERTSARKWQYIFFIEFYLREPHGHITKFYKEFGAKCIKWCLWGIFPRHENYYRTS